MANINQYKSIIQRVMGEHLENTPSESDVETIAVCDENDDNYILLDIGWRYPRRVYRTVFHLRLKDNKIWVEEDWTEHGIVRDLLNAGIAASDIEAGYQPPEMRPLLEWKQPEFAN